VKNQIWEQTKLTNSNWSSDLTADIRVKPGQGGLQGTATAPAATRTYTVKSGGTLSKISKQFYGDANRYIRSSRPTRACSRTRTRSSPAKS
jgi:nucleoid-associated protein YgaU